MMFTNISGKTLYGFILYGVFLLLAPRLSAQPVISRTGLSAFRSVLSLRFSTADELLLTMQNQEEGNIFIPYIMDYRDFLEAFISEEEPAIIKFESEFKHRLEKITSSGNTGPYREYFAGDMYLRHALVRIKNGDFVQAARALSSSYNLLKKNSEKYPEFLPNKTGLGVMHILAGSVPDKYKGLMKIIGFEGNASLGLRELTEVAAYRGNDEFWQICRFHAVFFMAITEGAGGTGRNKSYEILNQYTGTENLITGPLLIFTRAAICLRSGRNDEAVRVISAYRMSANEYPFYYLHYLMGKALLNKLDHESGYYLRSFVTHFKGKTYVKSAYERLAWLSLIQGQNKEFEMYKKMTQISGTAKSESDKQALREMSSADKISVPLLKARLLFDGGYYDRAGDLLMTTPFNSIVFGKKDLLEYNYRLGRISQETGKNEKALFYFDKVIESGAAEPWYFAANSALQKGIILEQEGRLSEAAEAYEKCLSMDPVEYKTALDQKARAGLKRMKKTR